MAIDRTKDTWAARKAGMPKTTGSLTPMPGKCGQQLTYTGKGEGNPPRYCMRQPTPGREFCSGFGHGGRALRGEDNPAYKGKDSSRWASLPRQVYDGFERSLADERLMDLTPDLAMVDSLAWKAAEEVEGISKEQWAKTRSAFRELEAARTKEAVAKAMASLRVAISAGYDAQAARDEVSKLFERKAKMARTFQQMQMEAGDYIPTRRVSLLLGLMATLVREFIPDVEQRREFGRRYHGLLSTRLRPAGSAAGDPVNVTPAGEPEPGPEPTGG